MADFSAMRSVAIAVVVVVLSGCRRAAGPVVIRQGVEQLDCFEKTLERSRATNYVEQDVDRSAGFFRVRGRRVPWFHVQCKEDGTLVVSAVSTSKGVMDENDRLNSKARAELDRYAGALRAAPMK